MNWFTTIKEWLGSLLVAFVLAVVINVFLVQHMVVEGHSMDPTLKDQGHILISKLSHSMKSMPDYGEIVVIDSRVARSRSAQDDLSESVPQLFTPKNYIFIKRVIGKPGDVLEFKDGQVYRNGATIQEPYLLEHMKYSTDKKVVVPNNSIFVMGDNRNNSLDSRMLGTIPLDHVLGIMLMKF